MNYYGVTMRKAYQELTPDQRKQFRVACAAEVAAFVDIELDEAMTRIDASPPKWLFKVEETKAGLAVVVNRIIDIADEHLPDNPHLYLWFGTLTAAIMMQGGST